MIRKLLVLLAALTTALGLSVSGAGSASADGMTFGCRIAPGTEFNFYDVCHNTKPASQYGVAFLVQNASTSATYNWSVPVEYQSKISAGCTSTSASCNLTVSAKEQDITVSVTVAANGTSVALTSTAVIMLYCGTSYC